MRKLSIVAIATTALLLTACGQDTEELLAESIQKGAADESIELSGETSSCVAKKALPLFQDEEALKEKITADENYDLAEKNLLGTEANVKRYRAILLGCLNDNERTMTSNTTLDS